jgi:hypothetical protein
MEACNLEAQTIIKLSSAQKSESYSNEVLYTLIQRNVKTFNDILLTRASLIKEFRHLSIGIKASSNALEVLKDIMETHKSKLQIDPTSRQDSVAIHYCEMYIKSVNEAMISNIQKLNLFLEKISTL